ncbi:MAG: Slp family lipoprotein, partial [Gammaproteobacteria bacterium]|nr:Slp family lipoprotein [Gammaproteobacteria bacterium]
VSGRIDRLRKGKVGQADYLFPVLLTQEIRLWPKEYGSSLTPRFNFGFGFGSGGSRSGGVGVGIGF